VLFGVTVDIRLVYN